ncbi:MAG TPA: LptA/OstA family protein [Candidatus Polarisedimenticolaceae bacterium]|nr:LptA/OstA family protein [Candidatus Polarisedimenticolaceae bacterium]
MRRVRLLRIVIPILLVAFLVAIGLAFRSRPGRGVVPADSSTELGARAEGFRFSDLVGGRRRLLVQARVGRVDDQGAFQIEDVERVEVDREERTPLVMTAQRGAGAGSQGERIMRLEGGVTLHDDDTGLSLTIPTVEVDQVVGVVRSLGTVRIESPGWKGTASAVIYSLKKDPTQILGVALEGQDGGHLSAHRVWAASGSPTWTLEGDVDASQSGMALRAPTVVLERGPDGRIVSATASPSVTGIASAVGGGKGEFEARLARATWDAAGKLDHAILSDGARIEHARGTVAAQTIEARTSQPAGGFQLEAAGHVVASGPTKKGHGQLMCDKLQARLDGDGELRDGLATGNVTFDGEGTSGEADQASVTGLGPDGTVTLRASPSQRARLASGRARIAAETIVSDARGSAMTATGRVESTLLPGPATRAGGAPPMFAANEAVHFVSASLESTSAGARLVFRGQVRGWQGDRTLAADEVEMIQDGEILNASGRVSTRSPRQEGRATGEGDFIQVAADRLAYKGAARTAVYEGGVRTRQAEGWLEAPRLAATLGATGRGLQEVQATGGVRFEFRSTGEKGTPTTATGEGDRAIYETDSRIVRLFGDRAPATVRNAGPDGGTTAGRVLRYHLDTGALEVESGERDRARIRTPKG